MENSCYAIVIDPTSLIDHIYALYPQLAPVLTPERVVIHAMSQPSGEYWYDNHSEHFCPPLEPRCTISFSKYDVRGLNLFEQEEIDDYVTSVLNQFAEHIKRAFESTETSLRVRSSFEPDTMRLHSWNTMSNMVLILTN